MNNVLWPVADGERVEISPLRGVALRSAICEPAEDQGVHLELGLLDQLMQDVAKEPGGLPLLQETTRALWTQPDRRLLSSPTWSRPQPHRWTHRTGRAALSGSTA